MNHALRKVSLIIIHFVFYLAPIILVVLGLTGTFNIFQDLSPVETIETVMYNEDVEEQNGDTQDLTADTRTFLYIEVIQSAIEGDYVLFGNSVGRGNTTNYSWNNEVRELEGERLMNEAHMLNVFTWTGILGVIFYTFMYLQASCLGLFCSRNRYVPIIACAVAFHWAMLWLEERPSFNPMDFALFLLLGICFSSQFRKMTDIEFMLWFRSCFADPKGLTPFDAFKILKLRILLMNAKRNEKA